MYQALYRKYRSQTFSEMVGQPVVSQSLRQAVATGKISHAYLFSGPRGTGKTSAAKIFAKAMNCPNQTDGEPCNHCDMCQAITQGSLEDVIEIDAASNNGVDEIRDIRDKSTYAASLAQYKVYIIDEVHMLSTGAFNALLKTLEEPSPGLVFILATTELHKIPATILSRVQRFEFKAIKEADIVGHLDWILDQEGIGAEQGALSLIARRAEGGMRDALSLLDQALSLLDGSVLSLDLVEEVTGSVSLRALDSYVAALRLQSLEEAMDHLNTILDSGKQPARFLDDLLAYLRDLLLSQSGLSFADRSPLFLDNQELERPRLLDMLGTLLQANQTLRQLSQARLALEMITVQLIDGPAEEKEAGPQVARLQAELVTLKEEVIQLKRMGISQSQPAKVPQSAARPEAKVKIDKTRFTKILEEAVENPVLARANLTKLQEAWGEIIERLSGADKALLEGSQPVAANEHHAILAFESAFNAEQTMKRDNLNVTFGNILSQAAGFSPEILAISMEDWQQLRQDFAAKNRQQKQEEKEESPIPEQFSFLASQVVIKDD
ncbi:DNA polymerase III subunit gamma/tau [Streptococcus sp. NLN64]|uniref:DNA polymerase III subunit gamma/tau n=1 Tax=Streptococcus sp. NLN64 TaxID=2822799 RepID=UPI0018CBF178|nr:DNA polymerase III subunit gamma/tau [Streptococcus sp. NLN64]